jgi:hypothetical protein
VFGIAAAALQASCIPVPTERIEDYLTLWVGVALLNLLMVGSELAVRWSSDAPWKRRLMVQAIQQFSPTLLAGAVLTAIVAARSPEIAWTLPGLWAILFSLGIFACSRVLPRAVAWVGVYYLASGAICLAQGPGEWSLSPWLMIGTFGVGQLLAAAILAFNLEHGHEPEQS